MLLINRYTEIELANENANITNKECMCWGLFKDTSSWAEGLHPAMHMGTRVPSSDTPEHHRHGRRRPQECICTGSKYKQVELPFVLSTGDFVGPGESAYM